MYNGTAVAVGCAVGIPTGLVLIVVTCFWIRQKRKYEKDRQNTVDDDADADIDLEDLASSPVATRQAASGEILRSGTYAIRKKDKVMGLKLVSPDDPPAKTNFKDYYESVIPTLPSSSTVASQQEISTSDSTQNLTGTGTPQKNMRRNTSIPTSDFYKILHNDSGGPMYPKPGAIGLGSTPFTNSSGSVDVSPNGSLTNLAHFNQSDDLINSHYVSKVKGAKYDANDKEEHLQEENNADETNNTLNQVSPFDTPPRKNTVEYNPQDITQTTATATRSEWIPYQHNT